MEYINNAVAGFILFIASEIGGFWGNLMLLQFSWSQILIDILIVSIVFYYIFTLIKGSRAIHILTGLSILAFIFLLSQALQLFATGWLIDRFLTVILVAIPVIFQQELRRGLEKLGQTKLFSGASVKAADILISNLTGACVIMGEARIGALIVLKKDVLLNEYAETGVPINAKLSKEMLLTIFFPKAPLHDGAVIVEGDKITDAACVLPTSYKKQNDRSLGTRHKAAIGLAEHTDAHIIVVSEERGTISYAHDGKLKRDIKPDELQDLLEKFYHVGKYAEKKAKSFFKKKK